MGLIGGAVVVGAVAVAAALRRVSGEFDIVPNADNSKMYLTNNCSFLYHLQKQPKTVAEHALKGSLKKRMKLFGGLAEHNDAAARPQRRYEPEDVYTLAPEPASAYV